MQVSEAIERQPLTGSDDDYDCAAGAGRRRTLRPLGEASHGTHEFYRERALLTRRLIEEKGFPGPWRSRPIGLTPTGSTATSAVPVRTAMPRKRCAASSRFPSWMWRNADVLDFVGWLRAHNERRTAGVPTGRASRPRPLQPQRLGRPVIGYLDQDRSRWSGTGARALRVLRAVRGRKPGVRLRGEHGNQRFLPEGSRSSSCLELQRAASVYARLDGLAAEDE